MNAFFVMAEYALVRSRRSKLEAMREEGLRGADRALRQIDNISDYISASQVGITMASIGIGAVGEVVLAHALEGVFPSSVAHGVAVGVAVLLSYLIITCVHIVAGEIVPKLYVISNAENVARRLSRPFGFFRYLFTPFIVVLTGASYRILRLIGVDPEKAQEGG